MAVLDSEFGPLRARNPRGIASGMPALLFMRPERFRIAGRVPAGAANIIEAEVARLGIRRRVAQYSIAPQRRTVPYGLDVE